MLFFFSVPPEWHEIAKFAFSMSGFVQQRADDRYCLLAPL